MMTVFLCDGGFDGILTGVYGVYESRLPLDSCRLELASEYELRLFCEYRDVPVDAEKAGKVAKKIRSHMSERAYVVLYRAALHKSPDRADWILRFIGLGLAHGSKVLGLLQVPAVYEIFQMNRYVGNEAHFLVEFVRFKKLPSGVFFGSVGPENDVLELVADHFADRFPDMDWLLFDEKRKKAAIHSGTGVWVMREGVTESEMETLQGIFNVGSKTALGVSDPYIDLWKTFFRAIAIEERKNPKCQRNFLPLRYRKYMTEFQ